MAEFKLPQISLRNTAKAPNIPLFLWKDISEKEELGSGSFGNVYSGKYKQREVVVKRLRSEERESKKVFLKEARILDKVKGHDKMPSLLVSVMSPTLSCWSTCILIFPHLGLTKGAVH